MDAKRAERAERNWNKTFFYCDTSNRKWRCFENGKGKLKISQMTAKEKNNPNNAFVFRTACGDYYVATDNALYQKTRQQLLEKVQAICKREDMDAPTELVYLKHKSLMTAFFRAAFNQGLCEGAIIASVDLGAGAAVMTQHIHPVKKDIIRHMIFQAMLPNVKDINTLKCCLCGKDAKLKHTCGACETVSYCSARCKNACKENHNAFCYKDGKEYLKKQKHETVSAHYLQLIKYANYIKRNINDTFILVFISDLGIQDRIIVGGAIQIRKLMSMKNKESTSLPALPVETETPASTPRPQQETTPPREERKKTPEPQITQ